MLHLFTGQTSAILLTLWEAQTLAGANYLIIFERRTPGLTIAFPLAAADDVSMAKSRYNEFLIDVTTHFADATVGQYNYTVYEQASLTNTDPAQAGAVLETGIATLHGVNSNQYTTYKPITSFTVNG